jgi:radical SAM protein with 4Fe4S-binding SPASM domain
VGWFDRVSARPVPRPPDLPAPGLYHYVYQSQSERSRVHLRVDPDGSGVLIVNANRVVHLNPMAVHMAYLALEKRSEAQAVAELTGRYRVPASRVRQDWAATTAQIHKLVRPDGACPLHDLDLEVTAPFSATPSAPYRMDLALTYRCNDDCGHCYNARPRTFPELDSSAWQRILDRVWQVGIPHVVFTGGEPTLRADLAQLIAHAERNGQITGMNTNGRRLGDPAYLPSLVDAGLDHVQITVESHSAEIHDPMVGRRGAWQQTIAGLRHAVDSPLYVMTNTTLLRENSAHLGELLDFLANMGVPTIGLNALIYSGSGLSVRSGLTESELPPLLELARERTQKHGQRLIWYSPTQYCHFDPMQLELGVKGCTAALYNMCVEPDGSVLPCQSYYHPLGNLLDSPWESIWNHELAQRLRERRDVPAACTSCALLHECGGGCPLAREAGKQHPNPLPLGTRSGPPAEAVL